MDTLVKTDRERFWNPEAWQRDQWVSRWAASVPAGSKVLDAGAGASKYRPFFAHCDYKTQDFCQYQGPLVKYTQPIDYVCKVEHIPLPDASLDAILCTEVIEHVVDPMAVLKEFRRLLKPGGRLLLTAPHGTILHMEPYHYYSGFTVFWYRHWLPAHGFAIQEITPQGGPGRSAVSYLQSYFDAWRAHESAMALPLRLVSLGCRMVLAKPFVHYLLPWFMPKLDARVDRTRICLGFIVTATRSPDSSDALKL